MPALTGITGFATIDGRVLSADKWEGDFDQVAVDRSNFTSLGEPFNGPGQRTGDITVEGPWEDDFPIGAIQGTLVTFRLGFTAAIMITVRGRITKGNFTDDKDTGPKFKIQARQFGPVLAVL